MRSWQEIIVVATAISGCQTVASNYDRPARIVNADDASRSALQLAVNHALRTNVILANNALEDSSLLSIRHNPPRTMQNPNPQGRIMEVPIQFRLVTNGAECILIDQRDRSRHRLVNTSCEAE